MAELARRGLSVGRLVLLWLLGAVAVVGWAALGLAVRSMEDGGLGYATGLAALVLGLVLLAGCGRRARAVGEQGPGRTAAPGGLGGRRTGLPRSRDGPSAAGARTVCHLAAAVGRAVSAGAAHGTAPFATVLTATEHPVGPEPLVLGELVYVLGLGATVLVTGFLGLLRSVDHQLWAARYLRRIPVRRGGGAHR